MLSSPVSAPTSNTSLLLYEARVFASGNENPSCVSSNGSTNDSVNKSNSRKYVASAPPRDRFNSTRVTRPIGPPDCGSLDRGSAEYPFHTQLISSSLASSSRSSTVCHSV